MRTYNVKSVRVDFPGVPFKAGQFLQVSLGEDKALKRYLSISNAPTETGYLEFTKRITDSEFSQRLSSLRSGDALSIQYPYGKFTYEDNPAGKIAFLSGGIGITPIRSISRFVTDRALDVDIILIYANRSINDIVFKDDFDAMAKVSSNIRVAHVLCEPAPDFKCAVGRINSTIISNQSPDYAERTFFLCGPPAMVESMKKILREELSVPETQIVTENFQGY